MNVIKSSLGKYSSKISMYDFNNTIIKTNELGHALKQVLELFLFLRKAYVTQILG